MSESDPASNALKLISIITHSIIVPTGPSYIDVRSERAATRSEDHVHVLAWKDLRQGEEQGAEEKRYMGEEG